MDVQIHMRDDEDFVWMQKSSIYTVKILHMKGDEECGWMQKSSTSYTTNRTMSNLPFNSPFSSSVLDIKSSGIMTKWWKELTVKKKDCSALETAPIILKTVLTPFLLLVLAIVVSLFVLLFERLGFPSQDRRSWSKPVRNIWFGFHGMDVMSVTCHDVCLRCRVLRCW